MPTSPVLEIVPAQPEYEVLRQLVADKERILRPCAARQQSRTDRQRENNAP
jgi:hypothetical protein